MFSLVNEQQPGGFLPGGFLNTQKGEKPPRQEFVVAITDPGFPLVGSLYSALPQTAQAEAGHKKQPSI